ncbi:MAG: FlgD immunoglobulin-like domain containing protein [Candidatus Neomarinimicrobiota bacterium]
MNGNYPNPFNPSTKINFELSGYHNNLTFTVFNVMSQIVNVIFFSNTLQGMQVINWNGIDSNGASVPSRIYFYQVQADDFSAMGRMPLVK